MVIERGVRWRLALLVVVGMGLSARAGERSGPFLRENTVQGFHTMTYRLRFEVDKPTVVVVEGDGDTPLALLIMDAEGTRITADYANPDRPSVAWTPRSEQVYQVKIANLGGVPNRFKLKID